MGADMFRVIPAMFGKNRHPLVRQDLARLYAVMEITAIPAALERASGGMIDM
jgi:hypothetical protein